MNIATLFVNVVKEGTSYGGEMRMTEVTNPSILTTFF